MDNLFQFQLLSIENEQKVFYYFEVDRRIFMESCNFVKKFLIEDRRNQAKLDNEKTFSIELHVIFGYNWLHGISTSL